MRYPPEGRHETDRSEPVPSTPASQHRRAAGEVRQGRRADRRRTCAAVWPGRWRPSRTTPPLGSRSSSKRSRTASSPADASTPRPARSCTATLINCFVQPVGDSVSETVDGKPGHLRRADGGRRNHASRRRRGLRLLLDPTERRAGARDAEQRQRSGVVHARVRPELRDGGVRRLAARRADGDPALRPSGHRGIRPRQGPRRPAQLQRQRGGHRRLHARRRDRRRLGAGAQVAAGTGLSRRRGRETRRRAVGVSQGQGARSVAADHGVDLRPCRAGGGLHRSRQPRRQSLVLRGARSDQPMR